MTYNYITRDEYRTSRKMLVTALRELEVQDLADDCRRKRLQYRLVELRDLVA